MEIAAERLLARLVPEQRPPGIGPRRPAEKGELQQRRLRYAPRPLLGPRLVDPEGGKGGVWMVLSNALLLAQIGSCGEGSLLTFLGLPHSPLRFCAARLTLRWNKGLCPK